MQVLYALSASNPVAHPGREYGKLTEDQERVLLAAKSVWEETEKSKPNFLYKSRIFSFAASALSFAAISIVDLHFAIVALVIIATVSALFFLMTFTSLNNYFLAKDIPIHMKLLIKIFDFRKLHSEFGALVMCKEGNPLNLDDQLLNLIKVEIDAMTNKMDELENILKVVSERHIHGLEKQLKDDIKDFYRVFSCKLSGTKTHLARLNKTLSHASPAYQKRFIDLMGKLSDNINKSLSHLQEINLRFFEV